MKSHRTRYEPREKGSKKLGCRFARRVLQILSIRKKVVVLMDHGPSSLGPVRVSAPGNDRPRPQITD